MHETGLYLLTRATGYIAAFQLDRHTGAIGPFTADLSIANAGGHAHTGQLDILEDEQGIALYARFCSQKPELELEDWQGVSACRSIANARSLT